MKRHLADTLKRTARTLIKLANRLDGPTITYYNDRWQKPDPGEYVSKGVARDIKRQNEASRFFG